MTVIPYDFVITFGGLEKLYPITAALLKTFQELCVLWLGISSGAVRKLCSVTVA